MSSGAVRNLGDDLILLAELGLLREAGFASFDATVDARNAAPAFPGLRVAGLLEEVADTLDPHAYDLAVLGGGGWAADWFGAHVDLRLRLVERLVRAGVPVIAPGQGVGPLEDPATRARARRLFGLVDAISLRDPLSREVLVDLDVDPVRLTVTGDDALALVPPAPATARDSTGPTLVVHLRRADYAGEPARLSAWAEAVDRLAAGRGGCVVGLAVNDQPWAPELHTLNEVVAAIGPRSPWRLVDLSGRPELLAPTVAAAHGVVAHSYHVALFAAATGTPTVFAASSPYYRAKAVGLARLAGLPAGTVCPEPVGERELDERLPTRRRAAAARHALAAAADQVRSWYVRTTAHPAGAAA